MSGNNPQEEEAINKIRAIAFGHIISRIIHAGTYLSLPDYVENGPKSAYDIAKEIGAHGESVYRLMRAMSTQGCFKEEEEYGVFSKTPFSSLLAKDGAYRSFVLAECSDIHYQGFLSLVDTIKTGTFHGPKALGCDNFWEIHKKNPEVEIEFSKNMSCNSLHQAPILAKASDFSNAEVVCDLGGSQGVLIREILRQNPHIKKGINFDMSSLIENNKYEKREGPEMERFTEVAGSFFESVPFADVYTLKFIFHDWSDLECKRILESIHRANPKARVYVFDHVITTKNVPAFGPIFDIKMFHFLNGKERTTEEWYRVAEISNYKVTKIDSTLVPGLIIMESK